MHEEGGRHGAAKVKEAPSNALFMHLPPPWTQCMHPGVSFHVHASFGGVLGEMGW